MQLGAQHRPIPRQLPRPIPRMQPVTAQPAIVRLGETDWRFAHPNAQMLAGINMERLLSSPFAQSLLKQFLAPAALNALRAQLGEVSEVAISMQGSDFLALTVGRMQDIPAGMKNPKYVFQQVGPDSMLMGSKLAVASAMRRLSAPATTVNDSRIHQAKVLANSAVIWAAGSLPGMSQAGVAGLDNIAFALYLDENLRADVTMVTATPAMAQQMAAKMKAPTTNSIGTVSSSVEGRTVRTTIVVSRAEAETSIAKMMAGPQGKQLAQFLALMPTMGQGDSTQPTPGTPAPSGKIVISGLDGGPKELETQPK